MTERAMEQRRGVSEVAEARPLPRCPRSALPLAFIWRCPMRDVHVCFQNSMDGLKMNEFDSKYAQELKSAGELLAGIACQHSIHWHPRREGAV
jgi:hypothetical protein